MVGLIISIFGFLIIVGILTTVHEFGHFFVARLFKVKVLRFSIGFGKVLFSKYDKFGTEYVISALPLGGYVKMSDVEHENKLSSNYNKTDHDINFSDKSPLVKIAIVIAGPIANIMFAILVYWLMFYVGISTVIPVVGMVQKGSVADIAGIRRGHEILKVNNNVTESWEKIAIELTPNVGKEVLVKIGTRNIKTNEISEHLVDLSTHSVEEIEGNILQTLGIETYDPVPAIVGKVLPHSPAGDSRLLSGDNLNEKTSY